MAGSPTDLPMFADDFANAPYSKEQLDELTQQIEQWHDNGEFQRIADAIEDVPVQQRGYELTSLQARAYMSMAQPTNDSYRPYLMHALELLQSVETEGLNDALWHYRMGYALYYLDKEPEALKHFEQAHELNPEDEDTIKFIEQCKDYIEASTTLMPVTVERIAQSFDARDLKYHIDEDHGDKILRTGFGHNSFIFETLGAQDNPDDLQMWAVWGPDVPIEMRNDMLEFCNQWNLDSRRPKAQVRTRDDGTVWVVAEWFAYCKRGLTEIQFQGEISRFINTAGDFFASLDKQYPNLVATLDPNYKADDGDDTADEA